MKLATVAAAVALLSNASAAAPSQTTTTGVHASGNVTCGVWTAARKDPKSAAAELRLNWVLGFITGAQWNAQIGIVFKATDANEIAGWIDNYCSAHPLENVIHASGELYLAFRVK